MNNNLKPNSITITYLSKVSFASLNGADKDVDNINPIKKITMSNGEQLPYVSSQALRRALRDQLKSMGWALSEISVATEKKGVVKTSYDPSHYIDDDLFGFMNTIAGKGSETRTSPIRVESLLALSKYHGDLDYGTNFMGKEIGADPNIFETEIHSGIYRGTILIELDRIGKGTGFEKELSSEENTKRLLAFIDAFQNLWSSGRQTRFLADISPKFIAAAYMKAKNPIFLEAVDIKDSMINYELLKSVIEDYKDYVIESTFAEQKAIFKTSDAILSLGEGFNQIKEWIIKHYKS